MNPSNFDSLIDSVLNEDGRRLPSGGKTKKERYKDPETRAMLKRSVKKHDSKRDANGKTQMQKRSKTASERKAGRKPRPGSATCAKPSCSNKATEADHTSRNGDATQNLCKSCHQKVTDSRREQKGLDLNSIDRAINKILYEADTTPQKYRGEREIPSYAGRAKSRHKAPKHPKDNRLSKTRYPFELFKHPISPQVLIVPKGDVKNDFDLIADALKPKTYHHILTKDGESYLGEVLSGGPSDIMDKERGQRLVSRELRRLQVTHAELISKGEHEEAAEIEKDIKRVEASAGQWDVISWKRDPKGRPMPPAQEKAETFIRINDINSGDTEAIPNFVTGEQGEKVSNIVQYNVIDQESSDLDSRYWLIHSAMIRKALMEKGRSQFKKALMPMAQDSGKLMTMFGVQAETQAQYEGRVKKVDTTRDLLHNHHALELNKDTGNYRWLRDAGADDNISRIAALVPVAMGSSSIDLHGNVKDVPVPDWLIDPETGKSNIERAEGVDKFGVLKPSSQRSEKKQAKLKKRGKRNYVKAADRDKLRQALEHPMSDHALDEIFIAQSPEYQQRCKEYAQDKVIRDIAVSIFGNSVLWEKLDQEKQYEYLKEAETTFNKNSENYKEQLQKAKLDRIYFAKLAGLQMEFLEKLKVCELCKGKGYLETSGKDISITGRLAEPDVPIPGSDIAAAKKKAAGITTKQKCPNCNGTKKIPLEKIIGYQSKKTPEEIEKLSKAAYGIMRKRFLAVCPECEGHVGDRPCLKCKGSGHDNTKLAKIRQNWDQVLRSFFGEDYFENEDAVDFVDNLFEAIMKYDSGFGRVTGPQGAKDEGIDYAIVYRQNEIDKKAASKYKILGDISSGLKKGPIPWGFIARENTLDPEEPKKENQEGPRRNTRVEYLYNQILHIENVIKTKKAAEAGDEKALIRYRNMYKKKGDPQVPDFFFEIRKFPTTQKFFDHEVRGLAQSNPKLKKAYNEFMKVADRPTDIKKLFRSNKQLVHRATNSYTPQANKIVGIGFITSIETGEKSEYRHPGEVAGIELAELRGEEYNTLNRKKQEIYGRQAYAIRLSAQSKDGLDPETTPMQKMIELWDAKEEQHKVHYNLMAQTQGGELVNKGGNTQLPFRQYAVNYIDIATGEEGRLILGENDRINIVEPLNRMRRLRGGKLRKERIKDLEGRTRKGKPQPGDLEKRVQSATEKREKSGIKGYPEADLSSIMPTDESIIRHTLPQHMIRKTYSIDDIADLIDD